MLYKMINEMAKKNYSGPELTASNFDENWVPCWFDAAKDLREMFLADGLPVTAEAIDDIIREQGRLYRLDISKYLGDAK